MTNEINIERHEPVYEVTAICEAPKESELSLNDYQRKALETAMFLTDEKIGYLVIALCGEAGEVADKVKKVFRDKNGIFSEADNRAIALELGDLLWYAANLAHILGYKLSDIAQLNIDKINSRLERGTLHGSGDTR